jgi:hypothetical protein
MLIGNTEVRAAHGTFRLDSRTHSLILHFPPKSNPGPNTIANCMLASAA